MSQRAWLFIAALGLTCGQFALAQQSPQQSVEQQYEGDGEQQSESGTPPPGFPVRILEEPEQSESAKRQESEATQREIDDLEAQQLAAESAQSAYHIGIAQTILAALGTVALIYSLHLNRLATKAASRAADAAGEAIEADRAWIVGDCYEAADITNAEIGGVSHESAFGFALRWKNYGRTPAVRVGLFMEIILIGRNDPIPIFEVKFDSVTGSSILGPGARGNTPFRGVGRDDHERLKNQELRLIAYSVVTYGSTRNPDAGYRSESCFEVRFNVSVRSDCPAAC